MPLSLSKRHFRLHWSSIELDMASSVKSVAPARKVKFTQIALPAEHGSWGFLLEPLVGGLGVAFSGGGIFVALMVIGAFLARRPLQVLINQRNTQDAAMRNTALKCVALFSLGAAVGLIGTVTSSGLSVLIPLALAIPLAAFQLYTESTMRGRQLVAEISGAVIMPTSAASILLAGGVMWPSAIAVWFFFVARFVPSIIYVRNRLNLEKGKASSMLLPAILHIAALIAVSLLALSKFLPMLTIAAFVLLLARSIYGLSPYRKRVKAMKIGVSEVIYGLIVVASLIAGHYLDW